MLHFVFLNVGYSTKFCFLLIPAGKCSGLWAIIGEGRSCVMWGRGNRDKAGAGSGAVAAVLSTFFLLLIQISILMNPLMLYGCASCQPHLLCYSVCVPLVLTPTSIGLLLNKNLFLIDAVPGWSGLHAVSMAFSIMNLAFKLYGTIHKYEKETKFGLVDKLWCTKNVAVFFGNFEHILPCEISRVMYMAKNPAECV